MVEHVSNKSVDQTDADGSDSKDIVLENMRLQSDGKTGSVEQEVLHYESPDNLTGKPLQEQYLYAEHSDPDLKQKTNTMFSSDNYKEAGHSSDKNVSLTVEKEYSVDTQLNHAKGLIDIGSHKEAIKVLSHVIDSSTGNWNAYLLNGVAYLSLAELNNAEKYLDMGLSINTKSPQLWLMRAIVEQQKGNHSFALQILQQAERIAPRMPEVQLNIGYSYDAIGNKKFSAKAYDSFLKLTEGKPEYMTVRHKVLERLQDFK
ncbi:MAG: hypothetical protein SCABRO_01116 [Candidatus Scalindua brodae]|uniref:Uncharacterized protein n=1 Tax=Candidatus Scalindua brodae TaxID=237368 RepID=A0A0B0EJG6_9BACT|nr:MAG: hypothetical protein SCABRO_01116 [Candidatus Scalindua brodae]